MNKEQINKCLDFAEGCKGKFTILTSKKPDFPDTLLQGTQRQREINGYAAQNMTTRQIAETLGVSQPNIVEHMRQYKKSVAFHGEWCDFWVFAENVRCVPVSDAFGSILSEDKLAEYRRKGIETVGDFLRLAVTMPSSRMCDKLNGLTAGTKALLFERIKEMCYSEL